MLTTYSPQRRPSWRGVLAGLVMGLIVVMAMIALALVLSSFLPFDLKGSSIAGGIYAAITALVSAFIAGYFAIKFSAPEAIFGDGTEVDQKDATLTGMLTAALIVLLTTFFAMSSATSILATAGNAVGSTVSTVAKTAGATVAAGASAAGTAAAGTAAAAPEGAIQQKAQEVYNKVAGDISREDIDAMIAKNTQNLDEQQLNATGNVLAEIINDTKGDVADMDFTSIDTWRNIDDFAKQRMASIEATLEGPELISRLQQEGLTQAQAIEVRTEVQQSFNEYKAKTDQYIAQAQQSIDQGVQQAEDIARKAALYSGLFWLISTILTFVAAIAGAKSAATNHRLDKPIVTWGNNTN